MCIRDSCLLVLSNSIENMPASPTSRSEDSVRGRCETLICLPPASPTRQTPARSAWGRLRRPPYSIQTMLESSLLKLSGHNKAVLLISRLAHTLMGFPSTFGYFRNVGTSLELAIDCTGQSWGMNDCP